MNNIIIVSPDHRLPAPLVYNLGECLLIITSDYGAPDAFELAASRVNETVILDHDETYYLYQCLHSLFQPPSNDE